MKNYPVIAVSCEEVDEMRSEIQRLNADLQKTESLLAKANAERRKMRAPSTVDSYFLSECGGYICRRRNHNFGHFEVWTRDGARHWRNDNRIRTWKEAAEPRHPMEFGVGGYSAEKAGQKKGSFTLHLCHCDIEKFVDAYKGNTIIEAIDITFRRKIPPQNIPHWLKS